MRVAFVVFVPVAAAIVAFWWWLGSPVAPATAEFGHGEKLYCVSYSPFRNNETPLDLTTRVDPREIDDDLARLSRITDCVRTYSTDFGLDHVAEIAARHGMKVIQGAWIGFDKVRNRREIDTVTALSRQFPDTIRAVVVGNEVLLRGELSPTDLAALIRGAKAQLSVPVTYADVWEFWLRYREVYDAVDFVTIHVLPYWEDFPVSAGAAAAHLEEIYRKVATAFPAKEILVGEVGWPSAGRMREGALPSPANQARVAEDVLALARRQNFHVNLIEAFDQPWKRQLEGTVGGHWGLLDGATREPKFALGVAVSDHPFWRLQAAGGVAFAAAVFAAAVASRRRAPLARFQAERRPVGRPESAPDLKLRAHSDAKPGSTFAGCALTNERLAARWAGVAAIALASGMLVGWAIENAPLESLGVGGWARSLMTAALAAIAPVAGAAALMRRIAVPAMAEVLGRAADRPTDQLALGLGLVFAVLCVMALESALGLVFDPRYRDFPFAPLSAAAMPFLVLSLVGARPDGRRGLAETVMAAAFALSALYVAFNESFANWQSLWLCAVFLGIGLTLFRARDARS